MPLGDQLIRVSNALLLARLPFPRVFGATAIKSQLRFDPLKSLTQSPYTIRARSNLRLPLSINYHPDPIRPRLITTACLCNCSRANQPQISFASLLRSPRHPTIRRSFSSLYFARVAPLSLPCFGPIPFGHNPHIYSPTVLSGVISTFHSSLRDAILYVLDRLLPRRTGTTANRSAFPSVRRSVYRSRSLSRFTFHSDEILRKRSRFDRICDTYVTSVYLTASALYPPSAKSRHVEYAR